MPPVVFGDQKSSTLLHAVREDMQKVGIDLEELAANFDLLFLLTARIIRARCVQARAAKVRSGRVGLAAAAER